ncbi:MAG: hypothetical protein M1837_002812 [Sclerophora amabilis]|nr:MAG: hypothetical protein M1837_002812 [Sclerophora amabilis]
MGASAELGGENDMDNGLGSLADELAEGWDEDEEAEAEESSGFLANEGGREEAKPSEFPVLTKESTTSSPITPTGKQPLSPRSLESRRPKHRQKSSQRDGSDYGSDSDHERAGISLGLEKRLSAIEDLARKTQNGFEPEDDVVQSIITGLRDLGGQTVIENGATRLITAHTALSSYLAHQTRSLQSLTYPLLSPLSVPPSADLIDSVLPLLTDLATAIPGPTTLALHSLADLDALTADLTTTLSYLSDTLHMSRQTTTTAARKLRATRELVSEMRREDDSCEEGIRWIERGKWDERLARRECAGVCGEVVDGFEQVLEGWRERLLGGLSMEVQAG